MPGQLELNYKELLPNETAGRSFMRENYTVSTRVAYKIPFDNLKVRDGFNKRIVYEGIEELAQSIKINGLTDPLTVDITLDGTAWIEKGHRRMKALQLLVDNGEVIDFVECYPNPKSVTEFERMLNQYTSNNFQQKLKPLEAANVAFALKHNFGDISNEKIAERMGVSRQTVDNLIILASASDVIKNQIATQNLSTKDALSLISNEKKLKKMSDKEEEKAAQSSMYKQADPIDINKDELQSLQALEKQTIIPGEDDLPWEEVGENEESGEVRVTSNVEHTKGENGKALDLVGNSIASNGKEDKVDDGSVKYDLDRPEVAAIINCIKLADKIEAVVNRLDVPEGAKTDLQNYVKWMQKDLDISREFIHKNKKQNKRDR